MNSAFTSILAGAARQAQSLLGESFTLAGETYTGTVRGDVQFLPGPNGIQKVETLTIIATKAQFDTEPTAAPRTAATIRGGNYWVTSVDDDDIHYFLTLHPA